jgi:hypothetical protein
LAARVAQEVKLNNKQYIIEGMEYAKVLMAAITALGLTLFGGFDPEALLVPGFAPFFPSGCP